MEVDCQLEDGCVQLGDVKDMRLEAEAVVSDVMFAVSHMCVSPMQSSGLDVAHINVETREGNRYCLHLSKAATLCSTSTWNVRGQCALQPDGRGQV